MIEHAKEVQKTDRYKELSRQIVREKLSAYIFSIGVFSFSFSIYFLAMTDIAGISYFTPVGGIILMIGWGCLIRAALLKMN